MHGIDPGSRLLHEKIENLNLLVNSLSAAVGDLEQIEVPSIGANFNFYHEVERFETHLIRSALRLTGGSQVKAARLLKLTPTTLNAKIKTLGLLATQQI
jgi:transcriptional regulator with GAF, ATPase, and Fis domain